MLSLYEIVTGLLTSVSTLVVGDANVNKQQVDSSGTSKGVVIEGAQNAGQTTLPKEKTQLGITSRGGEPGAVRQKTAPSQKKDDLVLRSHGAAVSEANSQTNSSQGQSHSSGSDHSSNTVNRIPLPAVPHNDTQGSSRHSSPSPIASSGSSEQASGQQSSYAPGPIRSHGSSPSVATSGGGGGGSSHASASSQSSPTLEVDRSSPIQTRPYEPSVASSQKQPSVPLAQETPEAVKKVPNPRVETSLEQGPSPKTKTQLIAAPKQGLPKDKLVAQSFANDELLSIASKLSPEDLHTFMEGLKTLKPSEEIIVKSKDEAMENQAESVKIEGEPMKRGAPGKGGPGGGRGPAKNLGGAKNYRESAGGSKKLASEVKKDGPNMGDIFAQIRNRASNSKMNQKSSSTIETSKKSTNEIQIEKKLIQEEVFVDHALKLQKLEEEKQALENQLISLEKGTNEKTDEITQAEKDLQKTKITLEQEKTALEKLETELDNLGEKEGIKSDNDKKSFRYKTLEKKVETARQKFNEGIFKTVREETEKLKTMKSGLDTLKKSLTTSKLRTKLLSTSIQKNKKLAEESAKETEASGGTPQKTKKSLALSDFKFSAGIIGQMPAKSLMNLLKDEQLVEKLSQLSEEQVKVLAAALKDEIPAMYISKIKHALIDDIMAGHTRIGLGGQLILTTDTSITMGKDTPPQRTTKEVEADLIRIKSKLSLAKGQKMKLERDSLQKQLEERNAELETIKKSKVTEGTQEITLSQVPETVKQEVIQVSEAIKEAEKKLEEEAEIITKTQGELETLKKQLDSPEHANLEGRAKIKAERMLRAEKMLLEKKQKEAADIIAQNRLFKLENEAKVIDITLQTKEKDKQLLEDQLQHSKQETLLKEQQKLVLEAKIREQEDLKKGVQGVANKQKINILITELTDQVSTIEKEISLEQKQEQQRLMLLTYTEQDLREANENKEKVLAQAEEERKNLEKKAKAQTVKLNLSSPKKEGSIEAELKDRRKPIDLSAIEALDRLREDAAKKTFVEDNTAEEGTIQNMIEKKFQKPSESQPSPRKTNLNDMDFDQDFDEDF